ncbi:hypothetical protein V1498_03170 [Peribacillus sp. SCS-26]|uniref:hypothetical protein n=1 Tax=Paraperibacillus marinus TaxID=3115295 RepID=UPI003906A3C7
MNMFHVREAAALWGLEVGGTAEISEAVILLYGKDNEKYILKWTESYPSAEEVLKRLSVDHESGSRHQPLPSLQGEGYALYMGRYVFVFRYINGMPESIETGN